MFSVAVVLHRSRNPPPLPPLTLRVSKKALEFMFSTGWFDEHPLIHANLATEAVFLETASNRLCFS